MFINITHTISLFGFWNRYILSLVSLNLNVFKFDSLVTVTAFSSCWLTTCWIILKTSCLYIYSMENVAAMYYRMLEWKTK